MVYISFFCINKSFKNDAESLAIDNECLLIYMYEVNINMEVIKWNP